MNTSQIKYAMENIHLTEEIKSSIYVNVKKKMKNNKKNIRFRMMPTYAVICGIVVAAFILSIPVYAIVRDIVTQRMEKVPKEEIQELYDMIQEQKVAASGYSRKYSVTEIERRIKLTKEYENGLFPKGEITRVKNKNEVIEGVLCYDEETSIFYFPDRELTDEEILEIIDFDHETSYALEQSEAAQKARIDYKHTQWALEEQVVKDHGISKNKAKEIAKENMENVLREKAEGKKLSNAHLIDSSDIHFKNDGNIIYYISFEDSSNHSTYTCYIDSVTGKILHTESKEPDK